MLQATLEFSSSDRPLGRLTFELFDRFYPHTVNNFVGFVNMHLMTAEQRYQQEASFQSSSSGRQQPIPKHLPPPLLHSPVIRIVPHDTIEFGTSSTQSFLTGAFFPDEVPAVGPMVPQWMKTHATGAVLSMCNIGPNTNAGRFFISLRSLTDNDVSHHEKDRKNSSKVDTSDLDGQHTIFGRVIPTEENLQFLHHLSQETPLNRQFVPLQKIVISACFVSRVDPREAKGSRKRLRETAGRKKGQTMEEADPEGEIEEEEEEEDFLEERNAKRKRLDPFAITTSSFGSNFVMPSSSSSALMNDFSVVVKGKKGDIKGNTSAVASLGAISRQNKKILSAHRKHLLRQQQQKNRIIQEDEDVVGEEGTHEHHEETEESNSGTTHRFNKHFASLPTTTTTGSKRAGSSLLSTSQPNFNTSAPTALHASRSEEKIDGEERGNPSFNYFHAQRQAFQSNLAEITQAQKVKQGRKREKQARRY